MQRLIIIALLLTAGCGGQQIVPELPFLTVEPVTPAIVTSTSNGSTLVPTFNMVRGSSTKMWVLHWKATVTNAGTVSATHVLVEAVDAYGSVRAADESKCEVGPGATMNVKGDMDIPETEIFKIKAIKIGLVTDQEG